MEQSSLVQNILEERESVWRVNWILALCEFKERITSLRDCTVSMFICIFESLFRVRIAGIRRTPRIKEDHVYNCTLLLDALANQVLATDLSHISAEKVVNGEKLALENMIEIFFELAKIVSKQKAPIPLQTPPLSEEELEEVSETLSSDLLSLSDESYDSDSLLSDSEEEDDDEEEEFITKPDLNLDEHEEEEFITKPDLNPKTTLAQQQATSTIKSQQLKPQQKLKDSTSSVSQQKIFSPMNSRQNPVKPTPFPKRAQELRRELEPYSSSSKSSSPRSLKTPLSSPNVSPIPHKHKSVVTRENSFSAHNSPTRENAFSHEKRHSNEKHDRSVKKVKVMSPKSSDQNNQLNRDEQEDEVHSQNESKVNRNIFNENSNEHFEWYRELDKISNEHKERELQLRRSEGDEELVQRKSDEIVKRNKEDALDELAKKIPSRIPKYVWKGPISQWKKLKVTPDAASAAHIKKNLELEDVSKRKQALYRSVVKDFIAERRRSNAAAEKSKKMAWESALREKKFAAIRIGKINEDYERERLSKIVRRQSKEEKLYRNMFMGALKMQRERIRQEKKDARELQKQREAKEREKFQEIQNHYLQQCSMLAEKVAKKQKDMVIEDKAQREALRRLERDLKKTMEHQIQLLRDHLNSEEERSYIQLTGSKKLGQEMAKSPFYSPSAYVDFEDLSYHDYF